MSMLKYLFDMNLPKRHIHSCFNRRTDAHIVLKWKTIAHLVGENLGTEQIFSDIYKSTVKNSNVTYVPSPLIITKMCEDMKEVTCLDTRSTL